MDKKPYFFRYKYPQLSKEYNNYKKRNEENAMIHFSKTLEQLIAERANGVALTEEEATFLMYYDKFLPVVDSSCVMNKICKYIEGVDFHIKQKVRSTSEFKWENLLSEDFVLDKKLLFALRNVVDEFVKSRNERLKKEKASGHTYTDSRSPAQKKSDKELEYSELNSKIFGLDSNLNNITNHMIYLFYYDHPSYNKNILWTICGSQIYSNIKNKKNTFEFPVKDTNGDLEFLYERYSVKEITLKEEETIND